VFEDDFDAGNFDLELQPIQPSSLEVDLGAPFVEGGDAAVPESVTARFERFAIGF
jgi:hypothetical protein